MNSPVTINCVRQILDRLQSSVVRPECSSCDCYAGLITQLELDCEQDLSDITAPLKPKPGSMHGCLGCDPCPPGALFADYLQNRKNCTGDGCDCL